MELTEARKYTEDVKFHLLQHSSATNYPPASKDDALICLDNRITELEEQRNELVEVCKKAAARQPQALDKMREHKVVIDNLSNKHQQIAFTFYNMLVQTTMEIEGVLDNQKINDKEK